MKIYLVGGAVRDKLLGLPVKELDWVVVGGSPKQMLDLGYTQVGKDFPVFLHPDTKDEYALARQERKTASGYYGFACDYNSAITLEQDLLRRDLTINAMAMSVDGELIDPYGGQKDLENKILRHVSDAFLEDPLRLLRVARFAARYHHLGFKVANETRKLMMRIVDSGELEFLTKERVWQEWRKSLLEKHPEIFFCTLRACGALHKLFPEVDRLFGVPATTYYHPEVDTGVHTLMVINRAASISPKLEVRFAAALHDLGKGMVAKNIWPSQSNHEELGCQVIKDLCVRYNVPTKLRKFAILVSKLHLKIHKAFELSIEDILDTMEQADAFRNPERIADLLLVAESDSLGRGLAGSYPSIPWLFPNGFEKEKCDYKQAQFWRQLVKACDEIKISEFIDADYSGEQIKAELKVQRLKCVKNVIDLWKINEK